MNRVKNIKVIFFLVIFFVASWFLLTYRIIQTPPGINGDEAAIGYNAALVARTGYDQNGRFMPLFVSVFDLTDWKQPITFYSTVLAFKLFGPSFVMLREVSVILVLISTLLIFLLSKDIFGNKGAIISLLIFITIPAILIQSHLALENIAPVPFIIFWLWMLYKYKNSFRSKYLFLAAISLGMGLFSYPGMRLIVPVYLFLTIGFIYYLNRKKKFRKILPEIFKFALIALIFPTFLYSIKNQYPGAILANNRPQGPQTYQNLILPYISSFDPSFLFIQGDSTPYHSTGRQGVFLLATLPLFVLGIARIIKKGDSFLIFILSAFFLTPLLYGLASSSHRGSRLLVLLPLFTLISSVGLYYLLSFKRNWVRLLTVMILFLIGLNYLDFVKDYWYEYPNRVKSEFAKPYQLVFGEAQKLAKQDHKNVLIQSDFRTPNPIAVDFFEQAYFYKKLPRWNAEQDIPENSVVIAEHRDKTPVVIGKLEIVKIEDTNFEVLVTK